MYKPALEHGFTRRQFAASLGTVFSVLALTRGSLGSAADVAPASALPTGPPMKIGIIGTGRIGGALARHWARAGHELMISSRHPDELKPLAAELGPKVSVGTPQQAAAFGEVILISTPNNALAQIGKDYAKELAGKIIIDTSNNGEHRDDPAAKTLAIADAEVLNSKRLVRAFNCINGYALTTDAFRPRLRRAIPIASDDAAALEVTKRLVADAGFDAVVVGSLASSRDFELGEILAQRDWNASQYAQQIARMTKPVPPAAR